MHGRFEFVLHLPKSDGNRARRNTKGRETGRVLSWGRQFLDMIAPHKNNMKKKHTSAQRDVKDEVLWLKKSINVAVTGWVVRNRFP